MITGTQRDTEGHREIVDQRDRVHGAEDENDKRKKILKGRGRGVDPQGTRRIVPQNARGREG